MSPYAVEELAEALDRISLGECANKVLGVKGKSPDLKYLDVWRDVDCHIDDGLTVVESCGKAADRWGLSINTVEKYYKKGKKAHEECRRIEREEM
ncbi:hypothetical protein [Endozoicomonas euniceicola]|uniref:Mor transcription activator domain-containing protein n=1 Tax=Endozoicomonas euniceicola TaxID=1234143 RepID=A0ABY6GPL7_9GAMM|nr:hypothetical protein [Endozoicomonas euniceicola]UYM14053.1 hypothetical protein NX720_14150 [Endozoicomonas euniceicola]